MPLPSKSSHPGECSQFGASTLTEGTEPGMVLGIVGYLSLEQLRGDRVDHRTDIFAFGAILYEMLVGNRARFLSGRTDGFIQICLYVRRAEKGKIPLWFRDGLLTDLGRSDLDLFCLHSPDELKKLPKHGAV